MMCNVLKLSLLKRNKKKEKKKKDRSKTSPFCLQMSSDWGRCFGKWKRTLLKETRCEKGEAWFPWFTKTGIKTRRLLWKKKRERNILVQGRWRIWGLILFWVWAGETPDRAICPCEKNRRSQTVSASEKEKRKRRGVTGELVGGREGGGRTGRHCVSSSPFYSFTLVPFWPLGGEGN